MSKQQMKQINLNEDYALSADESNIILKVRTKDKDGNPSEKYRNVGYYSSSEAVIKALEKEVLLSTIPEVTSLKQLITTLEDYLSKLHDNVRDVVKELRK